MEITDFHWLTDSLVQFYLCILNYISSITFFLLMYHLLFFFFLLYVFYMDSDFIYTCSFMNWCFNQNNSQ